MLRNMRFIELPFRAAFCFLLATQQATANEANNRHQLCWAEGAYDHTVYFAEIADREDRAKSFEGMVELFGITHSGIRCEFHDRSIYGLERAKLFERWKMLEMEVVNTTFLSDLDY